MTGAAADATVVRGLALALPAVLLVALTVGRRPRERELAAAIVATAWSATVLLPVNVLAVAAGWWVFDAEGAVWLGVPVDLWWAWAVLWGAVPALGLRLVPFPVLLPVLVWLDLVLMPQAAPVVELGSGWLLGEAVAVVVALVPAVLLARWTLAGRHVLLRGWAQAVCAGGLMVAGPVLALGSTPAWHPTVTTAGLQIVVAACLPGVAAMRELALVGRGTPLPYDPPFRLVTSGPYAYVRNPMQVTVALVFAGLALTLGEPRLLAGTVVAVVYGAGLAAWHEGGRLRLAFGDAWDAYVAAVPAWWPRWRPAPSAVPAVLFVAGDCAMCTGLGRWLLDRAPTGLVLRPAAEHPAVLWRLTYELPGVRLQGVGAFARALGHLHLGWALLGWALELPLVRGFAQLCADAFGAGPRPSRPVAPVGA